MKLRNIITSLLLVVLAAGCTEDALMTPLKNIKVSQSYVTFNVDEGEPAKTTDARIELTAKSDWTIEIPYGDKDIQWLKVNELSGTAGENIEIVFSNGTETYSSQTIDVKIIVGEETQRVKVIKEFKAKRWTVAELKSAADKKRPYFATGVVKSFEKEENNEFIVITVTDKDGKNPEDLYISSVVNDKGKDATVDGLGLGVGDILDVKGYLMATPQTGYDVSLEKVFVEKNTKSLIKFNAVTEIYKEKNDNLQVKITNSGDVDKFSIGGDYDWIKYIDKFTDEKGNTYAKFKVEENATGSERTAVFTVTSVLTEEEDGEVKTKQTTALPLTIKQKAEAKPVEK